MSLDSTLSQLSLDELQLRLMAHTIERPLSSDPGFLAWVEVRDAIKFHKDLKAGEARVAWKDTTTGQLAPAPAPNAFGRLPKPEPTPEPEEAPVANKKAADMTPKELEAKRAYQRKWHAKKVAAKTAKPEKVATKPKKAPAPAPHATLDRPMELAIDLGRSIERHHAAPKKTTDIMNHLRGIRRQLWSLLADLENLSAEQLLEIEADLALLGSAATTAHQMVGRAVA